MTAEDTARYNAAAHAMQSGVKAEIELGSTDTEPKHLRVGVNSALVSVAAIGRLMIDKGIITLDEYEAAMADQMEAEVVNYEARLSKAYGAAVKLA